MCLNRSSGISTQELVSKQSALQCSLKCRHSLAFRGSQIASHGETGRAPALLGLDLIQTNGETLYLFPYLFRTKLQSGTV